MPFQACIAQIHLPLVVVMRLDPLCEEVLLLGGQRRRNLVRRMSVGMLLLVLVLVMLAAAINKGWALRRRYHCAMGMRKRRWCALESRGKVLLLAFERQQLREEVSLLKACVRLHYQRGVGVLAQTAK